MNQMIIAATMATATLFASSAVAAGDTAQDTQVGAGAQAEAPEFAGETEGEVKLAKLLANRVAGEPQSCIPARGLRNMTIIDGTALVFDFGGTIYVNIPDDARMLRDRDRLVTYRTLSRMCSSDIVRTEDRFHGFYTGNINLNQFVPFKRIPAPEAGL